MYLLTNFITMFIIPMQQVSPFQVQCSEDTNVHVARLMNEYTYENGVQFEIKSLQLLRLSFFIVLNAIGMVLESV